MVVCCTSAAAFIKYSLLRFKDLLDTGLPPVQIARDEDHFATFIRFGKNLTSYSQSLPAARQHRTRGIVFYGDPGTFKSFSSAAYRDTYSVPRPHNNGATWFDGYDPQAHPTVVFDDFYGWIPFSTLLALVDQYQCSVQTKGGMVTFAPFLCVFTSNAAPNQWYKYDGPHMEYAAVQRRLDHIYEHRFPSVELDGIPTSNVIVTVHKGSARFHPLWTFMKPVQSRADNTDGLLQYTFAPTDVLAELGDTQNLEDAELELFYEKQVDRV